MAWTNPATWIANAVLTAAQLNTQLRDNLLETAPAKVTTAGDIVYGTGANALTRLGIGSARKQLIVSSGLPAWGGVPLLQRIKSTALTSNQNVTGTSFADVSGLSLSITTVGGMLKVYLLSAELEAGSGSIFVVGTISAAGEGHARAVIGSTNLGTITVGSASDAANNYVPPSSLLWEYTPAAGTYTVKLQARVPESGATFTFSGNASGGVVLVAEEWGT